MAKFFGPANHFGLAKTYANHYPELARIKGLVERQLCGTFSLSLSCLLFYVARLVFLLAALPTRVKVLHQNLRLILEPVRKGTLIKVEAHGSFGATDFAK